MGCLCGIFRLPNSEFSGNESSMPYQSVGDLLTCFESTLSDERFSPAEADVLGQLMSEARMTPSELQSLRRGIFEMVIGRLHDPESRRLVEWLEAATGALLMPGLSVSDTKTYFTPGKACEHAIDNALRKAAATLDICVFTITNDRLADRVEECHGRGIAVRIITDDDKVYDPGSDIGRLARCGIAIKQDSTEHHMHHKFAVIDRAITFTGSYNWTFATRNNHENLLKTTDPSTAAKFSDQFERLWNQMTRFKPEQ